MGGGKRWDPSFMGQTHISIIINHKYQCVNLYFFLLIYSISVFIFSCFLYVSESPLK